MRTVRKAPWLARQMRGAVRALRARSQVDLIATSGLFDRGWYLDHYPDAVASRFPPVWHYHQYGAAGRRDPNPVFDTSWYLSRYPDVADAGMNPVLHYLTFGAIEGRNPGPLFDGEWYLQRYPDVRTARLNPLVHYLRWGAAEGRLARKVFDPVTPDPTDRLSGCDDPGGAQPGTPGRAPDGDTSKAQVAPAENDELDELRGDVQRARGTAAFRETFERREPLVTICVATCNRASILVERCLRSLRTQSYSNLQIVVVGDHCTDDTGYRIAQLRDDRIDFENLPQRGPYPPPGLARWHVAGANAMNRALDLAEGDFVAHLDDDDEAAFDRIEALVTHARSTRAEFCWHAFWYENPDGTFRQIGNGKFMLGQMTTGSVFYHRCYSRIKWDVHAYRSHEPGDWNRFRRIRSLEPTTAYLNRPLIYHYKEDSQSAFVRQPGEVFLDEGASL